ncbi:uncharacterized protein BCR38DRAFT_408633 [Pseudomassariella vexata]|uniref:Uncharacterized protein n=1 Tax=Pseudomassariella vexata TaxID=1141098 RepID=A0A1Y2E002_9PEZI|nr:uncharacterized protein BCR38DRAFT_408633 [Pseudomassariella vexata]ORY64870.1 hypothetical protein BCR38DRAFT_408633 [Pseudomassariella vexata]
MCQEAIHVSEFGEEPIRTRGLRQVARGLRGAPLPNATTYLVASYRTQAIADIRVYPEAKFILVERDPDMWVRLMKNTVGARVEAIYKFPLSYSRRFANFMDEFSNFSAKLIDVNTR